MENQNFKMFTYELWDGEGTGLRLSKNINTPETEVQLDILKVKDVELPITERDDIEISETITFSKRSFRNFIRGLGPLLLEE